MKGYRPRVIESLVVQFVIRVAHSPTGDNEGGFETAVLVGQASETVSESIFVSR
jgi:hypothetical protein